MNGWYSREPITELKTAWDWLKAIYEYVYQDYHDSDVSIYCPIYFHEKIAQEIESSLPNRKFGDYKRRYDQYYPNWENWGLEGLRDLAEFQDRGNSQSVRQIFSHPPNSENVYDERIPKITLWYLFIRQPPDFFKALAIQDEKLSELLRLIREQDIKTDKTTEAQSPELPGLNPLQRKRFLFIWEGPKTIKQITQSESITASTWRSYFPQINTNSYPYEIFLDSDDLYKIRSLEG